MCSQTQTRQLVLVGTWCLRRLGSRVLRVSSCRSARMKGVCIHMAATSATMQMCRLVPVTQLLIYLFFFICAPLTNLAPTAPLDANRLSRNARNVKPPRISVANAAEDSPSLQLPNVPIPTLRENNLGAVFVTWPLPLVYLTARTCACFQHGIDEADEGDVARQDHMSADHVTPSAVTSES